MTIKHSKVSGVANTGASVGGGDWDADHVEIGFRFAAHLSILDNAGTLTKTGYGLDTVGVTREGTGWYRIYLTDSGLPNTNVHAIVTPEINTSASNLRMMIPRINISTDLIEIRIYHDVAGTLSLADYTKFKVMLYRND